MIKMSDLICKICESKFYNNRSSTKFCSKKCANRGWYIDNRDRRLEKNQEFRDANPEYMKKYSKKWKEDNKGYHSLYNKENAKKIAERKRIRYSEDLDFKIRDKLRTRLYQAIKFNKGGSAVKDLGCSIEELKKHIESQFTEGMNWDNYGEWHIDHIVPLSFFKLDNPIELRSACHYTNLQPLWATDNLKKGAIVK